MKIIVGVPAYNEEANIAKIILKLKKIADEVIVCDDGSKDLTGPISKEMGAILIQHEKSGKKVHINYQDVRQLKLA